MTDDKPHFNDPRRLFKLWEELTGEHLMSEKEVKK